jgi:hypothetical protein
MEIQRTDNVGVVVTNRVREREAELSRNRSDVQRGSRIVQHWLAPHEVRQLMDR